MSGETKNARAWDFLFHQYRIAEKVREEGFFTITSAQINEVRESRLMAKFDHRANMPPVFTKNNLSILPLSRGSYVIGPFDAHKKLDYDHSLENRSWPFPHRVETIDYTNLYSESSAIHCAHVSGIIDDLFDSLPGKRLGEKARFTVSGRMSTGSFDFKIKNPQTLQTMDVAVENSQCEIDGGFERDDHFLLIEAKNFAVDDFLIRQLYYPYRLWREKTTKKVVPVLMTFSNDVFSFFIFRFEKYEEYNSIDLVKQKNYVIGSAEITMEDLRRIAGVGLVEEPEIPFPQADRFERVVDLLGLLMNDDLTSEQITQNYEFDPRQTGYYTNAAIYLGLAEKYREDETAFRLTDEGRAIMRRGFCEKYLSLAERVLRHEAFNRYFRWRLEGGSSNREKAEEIMKSSRLYNVGKESSTLHRRAGTLVSWVDWIMGLAKPKAVMASLPLEFDD